MPYAQSNGAPCAMTDSLWLNVGARVDKDYDKEVAMRRAKRGVEALGFEWVDLVKRDRRGHVADTRHMVSKYLRDHGLTFREISHSLGRINHTTSVHSVKQANILLEIDKTFVERYQIFKNA